MCTLSKNEVNMNAVQLSAERRDMTQYVAGS
jgi:hypothetical protein